MTEKRRRPPSRGARENRLHETKGRSEKKPYTTESGEKTVPCRRVLLPPARDYLGVTTNR
jgi:hypothetical protein